MTTPPPLIAALDALRFDGTDEYSLQRDIAAALSAAGVAFEAEVALSRTDRIDFLAGVVGIEVKVDGSPSSVARQCIRYLSHDQVEALVVVSARARLVRGLPASVVIKGVAKQIWSIETWKRAL